MSTIIPIQYLVPTDFSKQAECALNHASTLAKKSGFSILLVHIIDSKTKDLIKKGDSTESQLKVKLAAMVSEIKSSENVDADYKLAEGRIFTSIGEVATEEKVNYIVMGTHGVKGMQHVLGAFALKVISSAPVPTIVVQSKGVKALGYDTIVYPVDDSKENKHKLIHAISLARIFNSTVHLLPTNPKESFLQKDLNLNMGYTKKNLEHNGVKFVECSPEDGDANNQENIMRYASKVNASLILIRSYKEKKAKEYLVGPDSVKLINNLTETAVMCVNPIEDLFKIRSAVMLGSK
ncbi:MAG: nucleotide-binding universal stress UspA family protein [Sphingobacteriales bacterium]